MFDEKEADNGFKECNLVVHWGRASLCFSIRCEEYHMLSNRKQEIASSDLLVSHCQGYVV